MLLRIVLFLLLNFAALGLGAYFTQDGVISDWYLELNQAPWTPPGWFFGFAWTTIMCCFAVFMAIVWEETENKKKLTLLFCLQWVLNVLWNPVFFHFHHVGLGLIVISSLSMLIAYLCIHYYTIMKLKTSLLFPYLLWIIVATSLNAYVWLYN